MSALSRCGLPLGLLALAAFASSASAQVVQDGGFESADANAPANHLTIFSTGRPFDLNWTVGGMVGIDTSDTYVFDGSKSLYLNAGTGTDSISQNIATDPTQFYTVSFFANDDVAGDVLNVSFGGTTLDPITVAANGYNGPPPGNDGLFTQYTFSGLTTASAFSALAFSSVGSPNSGTLEIDDITLMSSPVPEASTFLSLGLLLMLGLGGAVWTAKKKSGANAAA